MKVRQKIIFPFLLIILALPTLAPAHLPDQSYIYLQVLKDSIKGRYEITASDLNRALGLELPKELKEEDLNPHLAKIQEYLRENSSFSTEKDGRYKIVFTEPTVLDGGYLGDFAQINFDLEGMSGVPDTLDVSYDAFVKDVSGHKSLLLIEQNWKAGIFNNESIHSLEFSRNDTKQKLEIVEGSLWQGFKAMVRSGVWHIWIGFDHILFLIALLLPSVLTRRLSDEDFAPENEKKGFWKPTEEFKPALIKVIKIVTCFTIAHTVTLSLAALGIVELPSRLVESIIAFSIALAAFHNIRPLVNGREWIIAFGFGLFHGFGFASVLAEKGLGGDYLVLSLFGFNLGVEIGQLAIILLLFPVLFLLRKTSFYKIILIAGSVFLIFVSIYLFVERAFDIDLPLGGYILRALGIM
jgi:hypothetical protein